MQKQSIPKPKPIAYTVGDPAGIGSDIILQLSSSIEADNLVCIGDVRAIETRATRLGLAKEFNSLNIIDIPVNKLFVCGDPHTDNATGVLSMLDRAIDGCLSGEFSAMITGPLHKGIINDAGIKFSGHTEYLAERTGAERSVMLLASGDLRVALVTTHLPLRAVSDAITPERITQICTILNNDLKTKFAIASPRIVVCGLNPHAGEGGHLGLEEIEVIEPTLKQLRAKGIDVLGPVPADTAFTPTALKGVDVVLAMYHDQGLTVLKSQSFGEASNITLGLPIVRTSVDHGTALDIAGTGKADIGGLKAAINSARAIVNALGRQS